MIAGSRGAGPTAASFERAELDWLLWRLGIQGGGPVTRSGQSGGGGGGGSRQRVGATAHREGQSPIGYGQQGHTGAGIRPYEAVQRQETGPCRSGVGGQHRQSQNTPGQEQRNNVRGNPGAGTRPNDAHTRQGTGPGQNGIGAQRHCQGPTTAGPNQRSNPLGNTGAGIRPNEADAGQGNKPQAVTINYNVNINIGQLSINTNNGSNSMNGSNFGNYGNNGNSGSNSRYENQGDNGNNGNRLAALLPGSDSGRRIGV